MIELQGLTKKFGELTALDHLDLKVDPGEIFGFLGPNGAGKTTTIKLIMGLLKPTAGTVFVGLPTDLGGLDLDEEVIMGHLAADKKAVAGEVYFVLPERIGRASLRDEPVEETLVRQVLRTLCAD